MKLLKGDYFIVLAIIFLFAGIGAYYFVNIQENNYIEIKRDGVILQEIKPGYNDKFTINTGDIFNEIELVGNKIRVSNANCYDRVCVKTGFIEKTGEIIVCLPSKLSIKIMGENNELDGMVG